MKLARFQSLGEYPLTLYYEPSREPHTDMVRMTEYVEVEFPARDPKDIVPAQVAAIDTKIEEVTREFAQALAQLKARKQDLLALTDERQPEVVE